MAVYKCAGRLRFDSEGEPYCDYEADRPWRHLCPQCRRPYDCDKIGTDSKKDKRVTAAQATEVKIKYISTGIDHVDSAIGGGVVRGSTILLGGEQGAGKSSLAASICDGVQKETKRPVLYTSGEQSTHGVLQICQRAGVLNPEIEVMGSEHEARNVHNVIARCEELRPALVVFDSAHHLSLHGGALTVASDNLAAARLIHDHCERSGLCSILVSHLNSTLEYKGGTDLPYLVETEMLLHRFIAGNEAGADGDPWKLFGEPEEEDEVSALRARIRRRTQEPEIRVDLAHVRTLFVRKNRNGVELRKVYFVMTDTGQLQPLKHNQS